MKTAKIITATFAITAIACSVWAQGSLTPPGAPAPTMKTLNQVEPRTPINATTTPGDGLTVYKITQPGSYYLTTNLVGVTGKHGIQILANNVTVDLMGFEVAGAAGLSDNRGILTDASLRGVTIRNGAVRGSFGVAVACGAEGSVVEQVVAHGAWSTGIYVGKGGVMRECRAVGNGGGGFVGGVGAVLVNCAAVSNGYGFSLSKGVRIVGCTATGHAGGVGITGAEGMVVEDCTITDNGLRGLDVGKGSVVRNCVLRNNADGGIGDNNIVKGNVTVVGCAVTACGPFGIKLAQGGLVKDSVVSGCATGIVTGIRCVVRNCVATSNQASGILISGDSEVIGCHASENGLGATAAGIQVTGAGSRIDGNQVRDNNGWGINASTGDIIIRNSAGGNSSGNYNPSSGSNFGPVQSPNTATSPWANFTY